MSNSNVITKRQFITEQTSCSYSADGWLWMQLWMQMITHPFQHQAWVPIGPLEIMLSSLMTPFPPSLVLMRMTMWSIQPTLWTTSQVRAKKNLKNKYLYHRDLCWTLNIGKLFFPIGCVILFWFMTYQYPWRFGSVCCIINCWWGCKLCGHLLGRVMDQPPSWTCLRTAYPIERDQSSQSEDLDYLIGMSSISV